MSDEQNTSTSGAAPAASEPLAPAPSPAAPVPAEGTLGGVAASPDVPAGVATPPVTANDHYEHVKASLNSVHPVVDQMPDPGVVARVKYMLDEVLAYIKEHL